MNPFDDEVYELFEDADIGIVNLETAITTCKHSENKAVTLRAEPESIRWLNRFGRTTITNVANNHTFDYGRTGFEDTLRHLERSGIEAIGKTRNSSPQEPCWVELDCGKVAMLGYSQSGKTVQGVGIGIAKLDKERITRDVDRAKEQGAEWIILNLHWGTEYTSFPSPSQQNLARKLVDAGVDVIIGSHPHMVQGIEHYNRGLILYSLGNFNFYTTFDEGYPHTDWGMVALITMNRKQTNIEVIPIKVNEEYHPRRMSPTEEREFSTHLATISDRLRAGISLPFWLSHASVPVLRSSFRGFETRIKLYGILHALAMIRWMVHPRTYPYYLGLLLRAFDILKNEDR
jgi:poly-gamma-glutamate synthesis protein (capsule biosynthesis protein)